MTPRLFAVLGASALMLAATQAAAANKASAEAYATYNAEYTSAGASLLGYDFGSGSAGQQGTGSYNFFASIGSGSAGGSTNGFSIGTTTDLGARVQAPPASSAAGLIDWYPEHNTDGLRIPTLAVFNIGELPAILQLTLRYDVWTSASNLGRTTTYADAIAGMEVDCSNCDLTSPYFYGAESLDYIPLGFHPTTVNSGYELKGYEVLTITLQPNGGLQVYGNNSSLISLAAVPEPAAWATMLAGFGLAGATLRRRRAAAT